jgi:protocatechuate 3,4-dioxygenase beta subunit
MEEIRMRKKIILWLAAVAVMSFFLSGCTGNDAVVPTATAVSSQSSVAAEVGQTAVASQPVPSANGPIEVTYFTPAQQEGPYYTVEKPTDRDNDLTVLDGATGVPAGEIVAFGGTVYDANGRPIPNAVIEIWQTDAEGVYLHPNDPGTAQRDMNFQFYGEATTDENGRYTFRTVLPGQYEPRPRHIHFKVKLNGQELITSQFYFAEESGGEPEPLIITLAPGQDAAENPILTGQRDIILDVVP